MSSSGEPRVPCRLPSFPCTLGRDSGASGLPRRVGTLARGKSQLEGICTPGFRVRLGGPFERQRPGLPSPHPVFLESVWQPVCPLGWVGWEGAAGRAP